MTKIAVAMSGGVDSSIVALLLKKAGYNVLGLTLHLGYTLNKSWKSAAKIAAHLGLSYKLIEARELFKKLVIIPTVKAYAAGITPNPCVLCNSLVKIPLLWQAAKTVGCEILATGHYAKLCQWPKRVVLAELTNNSKSQSYFLARVSPELLNYLFFPLAKFNKIQVKKLAEQTKLDRLVLPESKDVCFLPPGGWDELIKRYAQIKKGFLEDIKGVKIAKHQGLHRFTIGQRRGLGIALGYPLYVLAIDKNRSVVTVGPKSLLLARGFKASNPLWYLNFNFEYSLDLVVRIRYAHQGIACWIKREKKILRVYFYKPQYGVSPGQLAVFMLGEIIFGSAWISEIFY